MIELPNITHGIVNFDTVDLGIYRGGQPTNEGFGYLKSLGVNQIIKLNPESEGSDAMAQYLGMELFYYPISLTQQILTEPDLQCIRDVVGFIAPGTFIHCTHGQDRTGLVVGAYRIMRQGWRKDRAYQEMIDNGFHPELFGLLKAWADL